MASGSDKSYEALEKSFVEFSRKASESIESIGKELDSMHKRMADGEAASVRTSADLGAFKELVRDDLETLDDRVDDALFTPSHYGPAGGDRSPRPFDLVMESGSDRARLVRCVFSYGGRERLVPDVDVDRSGSVWLLMEDSDGGSGPSFSVTQDDPSSDARAIRLYDFDADGAVAVDYRDAFLSFCSEESDSDSDSAAEVVTSLNGGTGDMSIIGGESISVSTNGQTITVSYEEGKDPDDDPNADDDGYCNGISGYGYGGGGGDYGHGGNSISYGWEEGEEDENAISKWPCNSGGGGQET